MTNEELQSTIQNIVKESEFEETGGYLNTTIPRSRLKDLAQKLRFDDNLKFDFLFCLTGVDWPESLTVVYHLKSTELKHSVVVKAVIENRENAEIPTVSDIWRTAEFHEREIYDLLGIKFIDHPDLRRIFLDDDWVGYPLRKDYTDDVNIVEL